MYKQNESINKEIENLKRNEAILELKSTINETKNSLQGFKADLSRQKKICELEDRQ